MFKDYNAELARTELTNLLNAAGRTGAMRLIKAIDEARIEGDRGYLDTSFDVKFADRPQIKYNCGCVMAHLFNIRLIRNSLDLEHYRPCAENANCVPNRKTRSFGILELEDAVMNIHPGTSVQDSPTLKWIRDVTQEWLDSYFEVEM